MPATVLPPEPAAPEVIHSCPNCRHWLPDGTLACPDCQTLTYGTHLGTLAAEAQSLEQQGQWPQARDRWRSALQFLPAETRQAISIHQHIAQIDSRLKAEDDKRSKWTKRLGPFAPIVFLLLKAKSAIFLIFKLKFFLSIFAFFGVYWALFGWKFALGFTAAIFIHEMGHFVMVKRLGLKAELPIFLPGFGAYVRWYNTGVSLENIAAIALAGPVFGLGSALLCLGLAVVTHGQLWLVLANVTAWLNLLNLIPIFWFDGAQATYALSRIQRGMITITCLLFFALTTMSGAFSPRTWLVFLLVGAGMAWRCFTNDEPQQAGTRTFAWFQILVIALGLLLVLTPAGGVR